ncbi:MAG: zf-HC2 domain-containing protein [Candidatus Eisenbacteria sp.]|nr:zf-HC2 domain-containing protein [Candidatus Eisenbacteria bacterium]
MDCRTFRELLPRYLNGELAQIEFSLMVEHEAACAGCQQLAAEQMSLLNQTAIRGRATSRVNHSDLVNHSESNWFEETLQRTVGSDCRYMEQRLAEELDGVLDADITRRLERHLTHCPSCRALAGVMRDLPHSYAVFPRLQADRSFAREVADRAMALQTAPGQSSRTSQARGLGAVRIPRQKPGIREVLRALWRKPESLWEGAVVCALLMTPVAGKPALQGFQMMQGVGHSIGRHIERGIEALSFQSTLEDEITVTSGQISTLATAQTDTLRARWAEARIWIREAPGQTTIPLWIQCTLGRTEKDSPRPENESHERDPLEGDHHELRQP